MRHEPAGDDGERDTESESDPDLEEGAAKDHADHVSAIGAERHTHADLARTLFDGVCHHAVQAHSGENKAERAEEHGEGGDHVLLPKITGQNSRVRLHAVDHQVGGDAGERFAYLGFDAGRIAGSPDDDVVEEVGEEVEGVELRVVVFDALRFGQPEHWADRILVIPGHIADVAHNADYFECVGVLNAVHAEVLTDRVLVFEEASNEGFVDDGDRASRGGVLLFDGAALHDFSADSFKEPGHDAGPAGAGVFLGPWFGAACDTNALAPVITAHGRIESGSDHARSGHAQEPLVDTAVDQFHLFGLVAAKLWVDGDEIAVLRFETKILALQIAQALAEQGGGGEQNERHRGLRDDQRFLRDGAAAAHGAIAAAQSFDRIDMRSHPGGGDAEKYSGARRDRERKEQNGPGGRRIDRDVVRRAAAVLEREIENQFTASVGDSDSENAADDGKQGGLD